MPCGIVERRRDGCGGVSEIVGAVLLVALVVAAVGIISILLFSQAVPERIPDVNFLIGSNFPPTMLYLYHNGGDSLRIGDFEVRLDGTSHPYILDGGGEYWTTGRRLDIDISAMATPPGQVTLVYNMSGGGALAIHSASANLSASPGTVGPDVIVVPTTPPSIAREYRVAETFFRNFTRIVRPSANTDYSQYFALEVTSSKNSWIIASSRTNTNTRTYYPLSAGNRINVTFRTGTGNFRAFGENDRVWNMSATLVSVGIYNSTRGSWTSIFSTVNGRTLYDAYIDGCRDYGSTLTIRNTSSRTGIPTTLIINDTRIISGIDNNNIVISRVHLVNQGIFAIQEISSSPSYGVFFSGFADSTKVNGVECNATACAGLLP